MLRKSWIILFLTAFVLLAAGTPVLYYKEQYGGGLIVSTEKKQALIPVESVAAVQDRYDVIVAGTDPEGVAAAVSAARNGLKTLLVDGKNREILGGLMTLGWLNFIDMNFDRENTSLIPGKYNVLNEGIFSEWYNMVEGIAFDTNTGANAFYKLVQDEPNIDVLLKTKTMEPIVKDGADGAKIVEGLSLTLASGEAKKVYASYVIDATQDADIAAAAGAPYTYGQEDLGNKDTKQAVTLVFRLKNVTDEVWTSIRKRMTEDNDANTHADEMTAYGYSDMKNYPPLDKSKAALRGLNIGRQNDNTMLINALLIFGIDGLDPKQREDAFAIGRQEVPHIVEYMKKAYPEFAGLELDATAPELYVRETRHIQGEYTLGILDILENRDQWDRVALGSYKIDIQRTGPNDFGSEVMTPIKYAVPFRSLIPLKVDNLLVVGRSASYSTLAHGTARIIPTGMAEGQSAGAAAKVALDGKMTFREMSKSKELVTEMQNKLNEQKMRLLPFTVKPQPFMQHKAFPGLKAAVYIGAASSREVTIDNKRILNEFYLDDPSNPQRMVNLMARARKMFIANIKGDPSAAIVGMSDEEKTKSPLTLAQASLTIAKAAGLTVTRDNAKDELLAKKVLTPETVAMIADPQKLTNGESYMMLRDALQSLVNVRF
ncbi:MAG: FAD-dependent oxidoreductase [Paenibacillaceae bacterium]|nr:FAD-dependent oxidoreductase [Paenibacillaceae bacterium]